MKGIVLVPIPEEVREPEAVLSRVFRQQGLADHMEGLQSHPTEFPEDRHVAPNLFAFVLEDLGENPHAPLLFAHLTLDDLLGLVREAATSDCRRLFHLTAVWITIPVPLHKILTAVEALSDPASRDEVSSGITGLTESDCTDAVNVTRLFAVVASHLGTK